MRVILALLASLLAEPTVAQTDVSNAARAKTIERLHTAGMNAATLRLCEDAGYVVNIDRRDAYAREEAELAMTDGFTEEQAYDHFTAGVKGQNERDVAIILRAAQRARAGDKAGAAEIIKPFALEIVDRCDLLAARSETLTLFTLTPLNEAVAKRSVLKRYGIIDRTK